MELSLFCIWMPAPVLSVLSHVRFLYEFLTAWKDAHSDDTSTYRDIGHQSIHHVTEAWIAPAYLFPAEHTPELQAAIRLSDELIDELLATDRYMMGLSMMNVVLQKL